MVPKKMVAASSTRRAMPRRRVPCTDAFAWPPRPVRMHLPLPLYNPTPTYCQSDQQAIAAMATPAIMISSFLSLLLVSAMAHQDHNTEGPDFCLPPLLPLPRQDVDLIEVALNLEYLEAEFFLWATKGHGLDVVAPELVGGGPKPAGGQRAMLSPLLNDVITQFGFQEVGHLRAIKCAVGGGFPRPELDISVGVFAKAMDHAMKRILIPPFNPYANDVNYLLATYLIPYVGLTGYVGTIPKLMSNKAKETVAGLLGVEAGQDAVVRAMLYAKKEHQVFPYGFTVAEATAKISELRDALGGKGLKDEGLIVAPVFGAEGRTMGNILAGDKHSLSYSRTPEEVLSIVYSSGHPSKPGGFFPSGGHGKIARSYLNRKA